LRVFFLNGEELVLLYVFIKKKEVKNMNELEELKKELEELKTNFKKLEKEKLEIEKDRDS